MCTTTPITLLCHKYKVRSYKLKVYCKGKRALAVPGGGPLPPIFVSKSCSFQAILRVRPHSHQTRRKLGLENPIVVTGLFTLHTKQRVTQCHTHKWDRTYFFASRHVLLPSVDGAKPPYFEYMLGSGPPPWGQNSAGPLSSKSWIRLWRDQFLYFFSVMFCIVKFSNVKGRGTKDAENDAVCCALRDEKKSLLENTSFSTNVKFVRD